MLVDFLSTSFAAWGVPGVEGVVLMVMNELDVVKIAT